MKVTFTFGVDKMRGMHARTKDRSSHGFTMRNRGSQVFSRRQLKQRRISAAEVAGKRAMQIILHAFSNLTQEERDEWHKFRCLIRREWKVKAQVGPEQTHPKEITYSDLDFYVSCNHHRVLGGLDPVLSPIITQERPALVFNWVKRSAGDPKAFVLNFTVTVEPAFQGFLWLQASPPFRSFQRHPKEGEFYAMATPMQDSFTFQEGGTNTMTVAGNRYTIPLGRISTIRVLKMNRGGAPYGYSTWRGVIDSEYP